MSDSQHLCLWFLLGACGDAGGAYLEVPRTVTVVGQSATVGEWTVTLEGGTLNWGPVYFCAGANADSDQCAVAVTEALDVATLDLMVATPQQLTPLVGTSGSVRSAMFDFGISWLLPAAAPAPLGDATSSLTLVARAERGAEVKNLTATLSIAPPAPGAPVMRAVRTEAELANSVALQVQVDAAQLWQQVNFDEAEGDVAADSQAAIALVQLVTAGAWLTFTWTQTQ